VVIVGAGFGGLECARTLDRAAVDVLLLDRGGYHLFTPLLYQVATALLNPSEITYPLRALFRKSPNVRVWATTVTGVDLKRRVWYLAGVRNRLMALASMAWYYLCLDRPIRIILQTPPDPIVATLRSPNPDKRRAAHAEIGGRTL
jgi:NADH dehydrogenase FAD-containing subunit